jgi:hypothetical protein
MFGKIHVGASKIHIGVVGAPVGTEAQCRRIPPYQPCFLVMMKTCRTQAPIQPSYAQE